MSFPWLTVLYRTADDVHERMIELVKLRFIAAKTTDERRELFDTMRELIRTRSPEQVARMERAKGLRQ